MRRPFLYNFLKAGLTIGLALFILLPSSFSQNYFQQQANYVIDVTLNDKLHLLEAVAHLTYINHSPDTLHDMYFHLYPNAYSNNYTALAKQIMLNQGRQRLFKDSTNLGYIRVEGFYIDNQNLRWTIDETNPDIALVCLPYPLLPNDTMRFTIPFEVKLPASGISRLGHNAQSYQISQWYPKPAVYDMEGWHPMPYLDQGEFYQEFGDYIVNITLPSNYRVGASGTLISNGEREFLNTIAADTAWKSEPSLTIPGITASASQHKTIVFSAHQVHDFAWFADKRYHVMIDSIIPGHAGNPIYITTMFTSRQSDLWQHSIEYIKSALNYFSNVLGSYPYPQFTLVQGPLGAGLGMEYPGAAIIGFAKDDYTLHQVIVHELLHSWFYGALATNERKYPYLDESLASALENRYIASLYPEKKLWESLFLEEKVARFLKINHLPVTLMSELEWLYAVNKNYVQPLNLPADKYSESAYYNIIYNYGAGAFNYLRAYLGDSLFFKGVQSYFFQWKNKHPQPPDLQHAFELVTDKNLDWFFGDVVGSTKKMDYAVKKHKEGRLLLKNKGKLAGPLVLDAFKNDTLAGSNWLEGFTGKKWVDTHIGPAEYYVIDSKHKMLETNRLNNNYRMKGLFRKRDPLKFQWIATLNRPEERLLLFFPAFNYTRINGFMPGVGFQNHLLVPRPFEFLLLPFYSFKTSQLTGYMNTKFTFLPQKPGSKFEVQGDASQFGAPGMQNYHRLNLSLSYVMIPDMSRMKNSIRYFFSILYVSDLQKIVQEVKADWIPVAAAGIEINKHSVLHPYAVILSAEGNDFYSKLTANVNYRFSYSGKDRGLDARFFCGYQLHLAPDKPLYGLSLSARAGDELYLFEGTYFDRFSKPGTSFFSRQVSINEGGLITPVNLMQLSPSLVTSLTFSSSLPWNLNVLNIKPFATLLWMNEAQKEDRRTELFAEIGLKTGIPPLLEIYVPLLVSSNLSKVSPSIKDRIRFTFNLNFLSKVGDIL